MLIKINGEEINIKDGSTIKDAIEYSNAPYNPGSILCLIKGEKEIQKNINKFKIKTPKGSIIIEMSDKKEAKPLVDIWKNQYKEIIGCPIRWFSSTEVAAGPFVTDLKPTHNEYRYMDLEVILSLSGFSNESTHIIFSKDKHNSIYGVPDYNRGVFAEVIGGRKTLNKLNEDDSILNIEPIIERTTTTDSASVYDLDTELKEGYELFTYVEIKPNFNSPNSVEHLFSLIDDGVIKVDYDANSFIGFYQLQGIGRPLEETGVRKRGTITMRNTGSGIGNIYIYRSERVEVDSHTIVGNVVKGMELIDSAKFGDTITIRSNPQRMMTLNKTQKEANDLLDSMGIEQIRDGFKDDDAIVVSQVPESTLDIIKEGKVTTTAYPEKDITIIELTDKAPRTVWYFRKLTGLVEKPIGQLKVHFAFPGMNMSIFEGDSKDAKGLIPENTPNVDTIDAGIIGVTNMVKKNVGLVGVRFEPNNDFGPTAEPFEATNIIGKVITDLELIGRLKEGEILYVRELKH
ncbi:MAG: methanogenesis marker 3 protein [Methanobrevibacter wolinii]